MAEYMLVDRPEHLIPLGNLDQVSAVPLTDAGLTPYHAIKIARPDLGANTVAVVLGAGGLGHVAIQILKAITPSTVVALDVTEDRLELARSVGADYAFLSDADAVSKVRALTGGLGAQAIFDFAGVQATADLGQQLTRTRGHWIIVGIAGGVARAGFGQTAHETWITSPYWGTRSEMLDVVGLAEQGKVAVHTTAYPIDQATQVYEAFFQNKIVGRAVIVP
jgi:propanol-preferring alcohol dehydrogenase